MAGKKPQGFIHNWAYHPKRGFPTYSAHRANGRLPFGCCPSFKEGALTNPPGDPHCGAPAGVEGRRSLENFLLVGVGDTLLGLVFSASLYLWFGLLVGRLGGGFLAFHFLYEDQGFKPPNHSNPVCGYLTCGPMFLVHYHKNMVQLLMLHPSPTEHANKS